MTHEDFKQRVTFLEGFTKEEINQFLDGDLENPMLESLFDIWKSGDFGLFFTEIENYNEQTFQSKLIIEPLVSPKDFDVPRQRSNKNVRK